MAGHVVVIGAGMAGLLAARTLGYASRFYRRHPEHLGGSKNRCGAAPSKW